VVFQTQGLLPRYTFTSSVVQLQSNHLRCDVIRAAFPLQGAAPPKEDPELDIEGLGRPLPLQSKLQWQ
jgi:hypothetical protein